MSESHVIRALKAKRAELSSEIGKLDNRRTAIKAHIAHLDAALRLFCYARDLAQIKPKRKRIWMFGRGELQRMVSDIEREVTTPYIKTKSSLK